MTNLFDRAKSIGLQHIKTWLPNGKQEGSEWVAVNPTRGDNKTGSFKVNLDSGRWADWADDAAGNDVVSLYAYIFRDRLDASGYKNFESGLQVEAAKTILMDHDPSYFPSDKDDFSIPKKKGGFWDGFREYGRGCANAPDPIESIVYCETLFKAKYERHWVFQDKKGYPVFLVARYRDSEGKKADRPFSVWTDGDSFRWRSKNITGPIPLYGLPQFEEKQNLPVLMVEGQKNAEDAKQSIGEDFVCTTVYRSIKKVDLEPLRGRTLYYWFDPDSAGRKKLKAVKDALKDYDVVFHSVHSPTGKEKGWDISDAISEGWSREKLIQWITSDEEEDDKFLDDPEAFPFKIVGQSAENLYFFTAETCMVMKMKKTQLGKATLMTLMDRENWGTFFSKSDGGIAWDAAANLVLRRGASSDIYTSEMVRGSGAWIDSGELIISTGTSIIRKGKESGLFQNDTKFVYEKKGFVPYTISDPLSVEEASRLIKILGRLDFVSPDYSALLAGWLLLAPFGGALTWRPHVWLTGSKGSGKSYIIDNIVSPLIKRWAVMALGSSTPAGIRQSLGNCSTAVIIDEPDTQKKRETIDEMLSLARQASSGSEGSANILQGTQDGSGMNWIVKSMFMFASIGPALAHTADRSRVSLLKLKTPLRSEQHRRSDNFKELQQDVRILTDSWSESFHARTLRIFDQVVKAVDIFREQTSAVMGTRRDGDQYGTLLAGAYMIEHDVAPTAAEAMAFVRVFDLKTPVDKEDEELCIDEIQSSIIEIAGLRLTIGIWLRFWFSRETDLLDTGEFNDIGTLDTTKVKRQLEESGVKPVARGESREIHIAIGHPAIQKALKSTPWPDTYDEIIERVSYCTGSSSGSALFGSIRKRYRRFSASEFLGGESND